MEYELLKSQQSVRSFKYGLKKGLYKGKAVSKTQYPNLTS